MISRKRFATGMILLILLILSPVGYLIYDDATNPYVCVKKETVVDILSLNYRSATILLSDNSTVVVNQATLSPGDAYCVKRVKRSEASTIVTLDEDESWIKTPIDY